MNVVELLHRYKAELSRKPDHFRRITGPHIYRKTQEVLGFRMSSYSIVLRWTPIPRREEHSFHVIVDHGKTLEQVSIERQQRFDEAFRRLAERHIGDVT